MHNKNDDDIPEVWTNPPKERPALGAPTLETVAGDGRHVIQVGVDLSRMVDQTIEAVSNQPVYQRAGKLVDVVREPKKAKTPKDKIVRPEGVPRIRELPRPRLAEMVRRGVRFQKRVQDDNGEWSVKSAGAPRDIVPTLEARGEWAHIRPLRGVVNYPVLCPDGSILNEPGYDWSTELVYQRELIIDIPDQPTHKDAQDALAVLLDPVAEFDFESDAHKSAWLAVMLTVLARPAIDGPVPLTLIDANQKGTGKTKLAEIIGLITTGKTLARRANCESQDEWRKVMLAIGLAADPIVLIDNIKRQLRAEALDIVLTGNEFSERVLAKNETKTVEVRTVFIATANNATLSDDLVRRSLHVRLECQVENPAERTGFTYPNLEEHVKENRGNLLAAALTVLRAYEVAGRPKVELLPMGSYELWSDVVRAPLVWAGLPDPVETQAGLKEGADPEGDALAMLFPAWDAMFGPEEKSSREVLNSLKAIDTDKDGRPMPAQPDQEALRDAVLEICPTKGGVLPAARQLAAKLRGFRGRIKGEFMLERLKGKNNQGQLYRVRQLK